MFFLVRLDEGTQRSREVSEQNPDLFLVFIGHIPSLEEVPRLLHSYFKRDAITKDG